MKRYQQHFDGIQHHRKKSWTSDESSDDDDSSDEEHSTTLVYVPKLSLRSNFINYQTLKRDNAINGNSHLSPANPWRRPRNRRGN
ncbi:hypothetical protein SOVF_156190 [Spinacia oleracea]|nr:hypothetical protein SOVF_156190 [Spinacia oleracea]